MEFEWDEVKRATTIHKHGIDFVEAIEIFGTDHVILPGRSEIERRSVAVGMFDGRFVAVVFTMRGTKIRIVTARKARRNERAEYHARHP